MVDTCPRVALNVPVAAVMVRLYAEQAGKPAAVDHESTWEEVLVVNHELLVGVAAAVCKRHDVELH